jgi:hypothetical protein
MKNKHIIIDIINYLKENKKWWLIPIIISLIIVSILIIFGQMVAVSPFVYVLV